MIPEGFFKGWSPKHWGAKEKLEFNWGVQHLRTVLTGGGTSTFLGQRLGSSGHGSQSWPFSFLSFSGTQGYITQKVWVPKVTWKGLRQNSNAIVEWNSSQICSQVILKMRDFASEFRQRRRQGDKVSELGVTTLLPAAILSLAGFCQGKWRKLKVNNGPKRVSSGYTNSAFQPKSGRHCSQAHAKSLSCSGGEQEAEPTWSIQEASVPTQALPTTRNNTKMTNNDLLLYCSPKFEYESPGGLF